MYAHNSDNVSEGPKRKKRCFPGSWSSQKVNHNQWHPDDDYLLINSILHLMNISHVYYCVEFSKPYQEKDIERRWKELLYNEARSQLALEAIRNISVYDKDVLDQKIPFNEAENRKLGIISSEEVYPNQNGNSGTPYLEPFINLLKEDRFTTFYKNRTAEQLFKAWKTLKKHINESVKLGGDPTSFEDVDMLIRCLQDSTNALTNSSTATTSSTLYNADTKSDYKSFQRLYSLIHSKAMSLETPLISTSNQPGLQKQNTSIRPPSTRSSTVEDQQLVNEIAESDKDNRRLLYRKLRMVGEEARRWTCLVEAVTERPIIDRQGKNSLATLTGIKSRFLIKEKEATFGRKTSSVKPDIDLSLEGPASRISRLQGCIKLSDQGDFVIVNWAKEPIFVDGAVVLNNEELTLRNDSMIIISGLTFRFNDNRTESISSNDGAASINDDLSLNLDEDVVSSNEAETNKLGFSTSITAATTSTNARIRSGSLTRLNLHEFNSDLVDAGDNSSVEISDLFGNSRHLNTADVPTTSLMSTPSISANSNIRLASDSTPRRKQILK